MGNIAEQTVLEKLKNPNIPEDLYVIEIANINGIVVWQKSTGEVYQTVFDNPPLQICRALSEFIEL